MHVVAAVHALWLCGTEDRPRAKGGGIPPPCGETAIFRRVGMSAQWRLAVSVGGFWLCSTKKNLFLSGLVFCR